MKGNSALFDLPNDEKRILQFGNKKATGNISMSKPKVSDPFDITRIKKLEFNKDGYAGEKSIKASGKISSNTQIRMISGGKQIARDYFAGLIADSPNGESSISVDFKGRVTYIYKCTSGAYYSFRNKSKSGPPTIDINRHPIYKNQKIKFIKKRRK